MFQINLQKPTKRKELPCINGWVLGLTNTKLLWNELRNEDFHYPLMNRINKDSVEIYFQ